MDIQLRGGYKTADPRLDRLPQFDERSKEFPVRPLLAAKRARGYTWKLPTQLDQGNEGACTGFSVMEEMGARPSPWPDITNEMARRVYLRAKEIDEWEGEDYEGSSVLAAVKAAIELYGAYKEYRWALGPGPEEAANDIILTLGYLGPVVMGTNWYTGMFGPDKDGYLNVTGRAEGGHAYMLNSYSAKRDAVWTPNSWGGAGQGWIRRADLVRLLDERGEGCIPVKRVMPKAA